MMMMIHTWVSVVVVGRCRKRGTRPAAVVVVMPKKMPTKGDEGTHCPLVVCVMCLPMDASVVFLRAGAPAVMILPEPVDDDDSTLPQRNSLLQRRREQCCCCCCKC